jgi:membrane-associated phospholipid phosphatase
MRTVRRMKAIAFLLIAMSIPAFADEPSHVRRAARVVVQEARRYGNDARDMLRAPLAWDAAAWRKVGLIVAADGAAFALDRRIEDVVQRNRSDASQNIADFVTPFGGRRAQTISAAVLVAGVFRHDAGLRDTGRDALEASILAGGIVTPLIKHVVRRDRPVGDDLSFPSGHATNAFAVASVFAAHSRGWVVPTIAYTLASSVAVARVHDDVHFASDVIAGAAIGTAMGRSIVARHARQSNARVTWDVFPAARGVVVHVGF